MIHNIKARLWFRCFTLLLLITDAAPAAAAPTALTSGKQEASKAHLTKTAAAKVDGRLYGLSQRVAREAQSRASQRKLAKGAGVDLGLNDMSIKRVHKVSGSGEIQVYVELDAATAGRLDALKQQGVRIELALPSPALVQGWIAYDKSEQLAALPFVRRIRLPAYAFPRSGAATSQGDSLLHASAVRALTAPGPYDGSGVKVGIISDGADSRASAIASGDLPAAGITMHPTIPGMGDEGTAILEIVHDLAPGAALYFGGPATSAEMVQVINWMANTAGCDVIADDLGFFGEPFFEDGAIAQAARNAVTASGRIYCSAAGNDAQTHYQGLFVNPQSGITVNKLYLNNFDTSASMDQMLNFKVAPGDTITVILQWNDRWGSSANDYELYLLNPATNAVLAKSENEQSGADEPLEWTQYANRSRSTVEVGVGVTLYSGAARTLEIYALDATGNDSHLSAADSIFGQAAVPEALACGAINAAQFGSGQIAYYSSRGPVTISFPASETRQAPFITGVDGVSVTGAGGFSTPFYGTSAAVPHVAAICALLKQQYPKATPDVIRNILASSSTDLGAAGFDATYGYGAIDALSAVKKLFATRQNAAHDWRLYR